VGEQCRKAQEGDAAGWVSTLNASREVRQVLTQDVLLGKLGRQVLEWERTVGRPRMVTWQAGHWTCMLTASRAVTPCTCRKSSRVR
jgi:hypothetical protein